MDINVLAKDRLAAEKGLSPFFKAALITSKERTAWCHLTRAQLDVAGQILREEPRVSHLVWLSSDALPVRPIGAFLRFLHEGDENDLGPSSSS